MPLLTYNYDTFLEKQFYYETSNKLKPVNHSKQSDFSEEELTGESVTHLHGYIRYKSKGSKGLILTDDDYFNAYLDSSSWVYKAQINCLQKYKCLFVGSSMSDLFQMSLIEKAKNNSKTGKWNCFALICLNDLELKEKMQIMKYYKEKGVSIIFTDCFKDIPDRLASMFGFSFKEFGGE